MKPILYEYCTYVSVFLELCDEEREFPYSDLQLSNQVSKPAPPPQTLKEVSRSIILALD